MEIAMVLRVLWAVLIFGGTGLAFGRWIPRFVAVSRYGAAFEYARLHLDVVVCVVMLSVCVPTLGYAVWADAGANPLLLCGLFAAGFALGWYHVPRRGRVKVVGITGTIGSGKSLVGRILADFGVTVIDTDHVYHRLLLGSDSLKTALTERFGREIMDASGVIDRKRLARIVFADEAARRDLNSITHPAVLAECRRLIASAPASQLVALLVPLLFEAGLDKEYDEVWTVTASPDVVRQRLKARDGLSDEEANRRLAAQFPQEEKARRSHRVIDNSGTPDQTAATVRAILKELGDL